MLAGLVVLLLAVVGRAGPLLRVRPSVGAVLGWPGPDAAPDRVFEVDAGRSHCLKRCEMGVDDEEEEEEVVVAGGEGEERYGEREEEESGGVVEFDVGCEERCHLLRAVEADAAVVGGGRSLVLWLSTNFADAGHSRLALAELTRLAKSTVRCTARVYLYSGWAPRNQRVLRWWRHEQKNNNNNKDGSPWGVSSDSFGGWGRATLTLVEDGHVLWTSFDIVHSSSHRDLVAAVGSHKREFDAGTSLGQALAAEVAVAGDEHLPFRTCMAIAKGVNSENVPLQQFLHTPDHLEALAHHCLPAPADDHHAHRNDIDYDRFHTMASHLGLVNHTDHLFQVAAQTFATVLDSASEPQVLIYVAWVAAYEDGMKGGLGVGERHDALLISLCFSNSSVPHGLAERFEVLGRQPATVNSDHFLALVPCQTDTRHVLQCIKAVLADVLAANAATATASRPLELAGLLLGAGLAHNPAYKSLRHFWSADQGLTEEGQFPPDHVSEKFAHELHNRRNSNAKDEL
jgi:hypothetical protein